MTDPHAITVPSFPAGSIAQTRASQRGRWWRHRWRPWRQVRRDEHGGPAVEFALAAPIILMTLAAFVEFGMYGLVTVLIEGSLRDVARYGITGQVPEGGDIVGHMRQMIGDATHGLVDPDEIVLTIRSYPTFDDVGQGEDFVDGNGNGTYDAGETFKDCNGNGTRDADRGSTGTGGSSQVVVYQVDYDWRLWTQVMAPVIGHDGMVHIQASTVVRNEPWDPDSSLHPPESCTL
ncbi:MAG: pilus assembly protein [Defluviicoccus sp.]|nr:MAG: pilus assembly protein [Defluviicoccus sp.]